MAGGEGTATTRAASPSADFPASLPVRALERANALAARLERCGPVLFAALSVVYLVITAILASRKLMWNDELYTYYIARLPGMSDVWMALASRGEQTPPFFYVVTRSALGLFGATNLSIRLPEIIGFWVMSASLFVFVRRRTSALAALCAAALPLVTMAYFYAFEARPYGVVLGFGGLAFVSWQAVALERGRVLPPAALGLSLAAAVSTHYYGVFIIAALAAGELTRTLIRRRVDPAVWAAFALPVLPLALHLPLIRAGASYSEAFWSPARWVDIPDFYAYLLTPAVVPLAVILALAAAYVLIGPAGRQEDGLRGESPTLASDAAAAAGFIVIPFLAVVTAKVGTGAFTHRYALPAVIGFAALAGLGVGRGCRKHPVMALVTAACLAGWFVLAQARELVQPSGFSQPLTRQLVDRPAEWLAAAPERTLPLVIADPHNFTVLSHYGAPDLRSRIVYLADPDLALKHLGHNSVERGMLDLIAPWFGMNVVEFEPFVRDHPEFLVYGDFIRLAFLNWIVPELRARGMRVELLNRAGDNMLLRASREAGASP